MVEGVDIGPQPTQQVATAIVFQHGRGQGLEPLVEPDPQGREHAQGRLMGDQSLAVAAHRTYDGAGADHRRRGEVVHAHACCAGNGHGGDEPARHGHQDHIGQQGGQGQQTTQ